MRVRSASNCVVVVEKDVTASAWCEVTALGCGSALSSAVARNTQRQTRAPPHSLPTAFCNSSAAVFRTQGYLRGHSSLALQHSATLNLDSLLNADNYASVRFEMHIYVN